MSDPPRRPIISASELKGRIRDPRLRLADVRWHLGQTGRGASQYRAGHIPGAIFVDLDRDLAAPPGPGRHPLPDPLELARRLGALGFGDEHAIVAYDDLSGTVAARLWWMLERLGHRHVAVLDGGLPAWLAAGGELTTETPSHPAETLTLRPAWPGLEERGVIDREALAVRLGSLDLVDLRAAERYRGEVEPVDPVPGHIPTARSVPALDLLDGEGRLLGASELRARLLAGGPVASSGPEEIPMVMSCGSGVTACFGALAARLASLPEPLVYAGSYSDWSAAGMRIATGASPGAPPG
jgi:thiosulfate/3-mercaptopyruvate sulfurtransferase